MCQLQAVIFAHAAGAVLPGGEGEHVVVREHIEVMCVPAGQQGPREVPQLQNRGFGGCSFVHRCRVKITILLVEGLIAAPSSAAQERGSQGALDACVLQFETSLAACSSPEAASRRARGRWLPLETASGQLLE